MLTERLKNIANSAERVEQGGIMEQCGCMDYVVIIRMVGEMLKKEEKLYGAFIRWANL